MRRCLIAGTVVLAFVVSASVLAAATRPPVGTYRTANGVLGRLTVGRGGQLISALKFGKYAVGNCGGSANPSPALGNVTIAVRGSFAIRPYTINRFSTWMIGHPDATTPTGGSRVRATFTVRPGHGIKSGTLSALFDPTNNRAVKVSATVIYDPRHRAASACTYTLDYLHR